jgi:hypothetical protein
MWPCSGPQQLKLLGDKIVFCVGLGQSRTLQVPVAQQLSVSLHKTSLPAHVQAHAHCFSYVSLSLSLRCTRIAAAAPAPATGDKLQLQGLCAFDAAVHCASMTTWPTSAGGSHHSKHAGSKAHWIRGLLQRLLSRIDPVGAAGLQST